MLSAIRVVKTNGVNVNYPIGLYYSDSAPLMLIDAEGLDPYDTVINTEETINKPGSFFNSSRIPNRFVNLTIGYNRYSNLKSFAQFREHLYKVFDLGSITRLSFSYKGLNDRVIDGYVEKIDIPLFSENPYAIVRIVCPDPLFWEYNEQEFVSSLDSNDIPDDMFGTAPSTLTIEKQLGNSASDLKVSMSNGDYIHFVGLPARSKLVMSFQYSYRNILLTVDGERKNPYQYLRDLTGMFEASKGKARITVSNTTNDTPPGFKVKLRRHYISV